MNDGEKISRRHGVGHPRVIKEKGCRKLSRLVKLSRRQWHPNIIHVLLKCFLSTHFRWPYWIWDYAAKVPLMAISWQYIIVNYSYTRPRKIMTGPWIIRRQLSNRKKWRFIFQHVDGHVRVHCFPGKLLLPFIYIESYRGLWWRYYTLTNVFMNLSGTWGRDRANHEGRQLSDYHYWQTANLHCVCVPKMEIVFEKGNVSCHRWWILLE